MAENGVSHKKTIVVIVRVSLILLSQLSSLMTIHISSLPRESSIRIDASTLIILSNTTSPVFIFYFTNYLSLTGKRVEMKSTKLTFLWSFLASVTSRDSFWNSRYDPIIIIRGGGGREGEQRKTITRRTKRRRKSSLQ